MIDVEYMERGWVRMWGVVEGGEGMYVFWVMGEYEGWLL